MSPEMKMALVAVVYLTVSIGGMAWVRNRIERNIAEGRIWWKDR